MRTDGRWGRLVVQALLGWLLGGTLPAAEVELVPAGAVWRHLPGTAEASAPDRTAWRLAGFNDSAWASGALPLFYGENLTGTLVSGMQGSYGSRFVRTRFQLATPADVRNLVLHAGCDDGFVAWVNGVEVARYNLPEGDLGLGSFALTAAPEPVVELDYPMGGIQSALRVGENVLAVQVYNVNLTSSDLVFTARLTAELDEEPPVVTSLIPEPGAVVSDLRSVEVQFSEAVSGVDAGDLLVNGTAATAVQFVGPGQYVFTFAAPPAGAVRVEFREGHGIRDQSSAARALVAAPWQYTVDPRAVVTLRINEFLADNDAGIRDEDGRRSDWIEIHNPGNQSISLFGWSLTDDAGNLRKWRFPALSVPARGYALVWASGNDRTNPAAPLHTNFRLAEDGEFLGLVSPAGELVSGFAPAYPRQRPDVAYGRLAGSSSDGFLPVPTPRAPNATGGPGFAPDVVSEPTSRTYTTPIQLQLGASTNGGPIPAGTVIRYTLDGSLPGLSSPVWSGPLNLSNQAVQVRARAYTPGLLPGRPTSTVLLPLATAVARFTSDLPVVVIHDFNRGRPPANERIPAYFQVFEPGPDGVTVLTNAPTQVSRAGISVRGSSTEGLPKASLRVEFRDEFDEDRRVSFLGMPEEGDWVMYGPNSFEPVLIHNPFMHDLSRAIGRYSPRTRFCEVFLVTIGTNQVQSGSYNGVYVAMERIEVGSDRVDLGSLEPENLTPPSVTGGYLMKIDRLDPGDSGIVAGGLGFAMVEPKESELEEPAREPQLRYLTSYMNAFGSALQGAGYRDPVTGYRAYIDEGSWIDHHLLNTFAFNVDALRLSAYFGKRRNGRLEFGPLWDFDRALGSLDGRDANPSVWMSQVGDRGTDFFNFPWWGRMFTDLEFFQKYIDRYQYLRRGELSDVALGQRADGLADQVRRAAVRDWAKWGGSPRVATFQQEINLMKAWMRSRTAFMDSQFVPYPQLGRTPGVVARGSTVSLVVPAGATVYYTTNGVDPRMSGGGIHPSARAYTSPVSIQGNTRLRARTHKPNHTALTGPSNPPLLSVWSGETAGAYITDPMPLEVSEVHFAPEDGPDGGPEDFEFVELRNAGTTPIDLTGVRLTGAVTFETAATNVLRVLPPGGRVVVVSDPGAFAQRYPGVDAVLGAFSGRLANEGETLEVVGPLGEQVVAVPYLPNWLGTNGVAGHSLVPVREGSDPIAAAQSVSWRSSAVRGGSPGRMDAASLPVAEALGVEWTGAGVRLRVRMTAGIGLEVQGRGQLDSGTWEPVRTYSAGAAREEVLEVLPGLETRYYRAISRVP